MPVEHPVVQISLDLTSVPEALDHAQKAVRAGVDWLEAGTPLILAEGLHAIEALHKQFPQYPIVADLKTMDGGYLEAEMMAKAGASHVVVMARAHPATLKAVIQAGRDYGVKVMGDDLGCPDKPAAARAMQDLGVDYVIHHVGYDERRDAEVIHAHGGRAPSPLDELRSVVNAVRIPVQAVGGLSVAEVIQLPSYGVRHLVLGAPLTVDADAFKSPAHDLEGLLREIIANLRSPASSRAAE
ncbi:MAG: orotidine 5'-phosphate decarboxylase / HUMPS family protein [Terriglobia bacterium]